MDFTATTSGALLSQCLLIYSSGVHPGTYDLKEIFTSDSNMQPGFENHWIGNTKNMTDIYGNSNNGKKNLKFKQRNGKAKEFEQPESI